MISGGGGGSTRQTKAMEGANTVTKAQILVPK